MFLGNIVVMKLTSNRTFAIPLVMLSSPHHHELCIDRQCNSNSLKNNSDMSLSTTTSKERASWKICKYDIFEIIRSVWNKTSASFLGRFSSIFAPCYRLHCWRYIVWYWDILYVLHGTSTWRITLVHTLHWWIIFCILKWKIVYSYEGLELLP